MEKAKLVLEYVRVVLSWPVVTAALSGAFLWQFKRQIGAALDRIASIRLPGGSELLMPQQSANNALSGAAPEPIPQTPALPAANPQDEQRIQTERDRAQLWEFRFLNLYLVPRTQLVLDWLASRPSMGLHTFDAWLMESVPSVVERSAVFNALQNHHLINLENGLIVVTPKGNGYIQWRGPAVEFLRARIGTPPPASLLPTTAPPLGGTLEKIAASLAEPFGEKTKDA